MKQTIWKFPFEVEDEFEIEMPSGAQVIHIGVQTIHEPHQLESKQACMWAIVNPEEPREDWHKFKFRVFGTGHAIPDTGHYGTHHYVSTFQMYDGALVWHVFFNEVTS